jgi:hypothetical protein
MPDPIGFLASVLRGTYNGMSDAGQAVAQSAYSAATLPRDVYQGKVQTDPRFMSDEEFGRAVELAGNMAGGGLTLGKAPEGAVGMFAGPRAKTWDANANSTARAYSSIGDPTTGFQRTGHFQGVDNKWRFEIPDRNATIKPPPADLQAGQTLRAADYLDHPELFKAYPELAEMPVMHQPGMTGASYTPAHDIGNGPVPAMLRMDMTKDVTGPGMMQPRSMMLHELQHGVQNIEGFAPGPGGGPLAPEITAAGPNRALQRKYNDTLAEGTGPDRQNAKAAYEWSKYRDYARSAGEVEARQVQERADWAPERLREMHPVQQQMTPNYPGDPTLRFSPQQQWVPGQQLPYPVDQYNPNLPFLAQYLGK